MRPARDTQPALPPSVAVDDATLCVRLRGGDEQALEVLFRRHAPGLCRAAYRYVKSTALAEEVVQDVLLHVWERRASLDIHGSVAAYFHTAVRRRAFDTLKSARAGERANDAASTMRAPERSPLESAVADDLAAVVRAALDRLPERCRLVLQLRWDAELSYAEIGEVLGVTIKAVERQRQRGLKLLARALRSIRR
jgi:RNA polymerase sigma-70 factor (ECF subfamily)